MINIMRTKIILSRVVKYIFSAAVQNVTQVIY